MKILEKKFQTLFSHWIKENATYTFAYELKSVDTSLPFSAVEEHQILGLWNAKHNKVGKKLEDVGYQQPFDGFVLHHVPAFVGIRFGTGNAFFIDIDIFVAESKNSARRSLTESRAQKIASFEATL
jgi:hypothetical protein